MLAVGDRPGPERRVWREVCALLEDLDRLVAMAEDWIDFGQAGQVDYARRIADLGKQVAADDAAISGAVVAAAEQPDAGAAIEQAVLTLAKERQRTVQLPEGTKLWRQEAEDAAQRGRDLQKLVEVARHRLRDMGPEQRAKILDLLEIQVTVLGGIPQKVRSDDGVSTWSRERARRVPLLTDDVWAKIEAFFVGRMSRRLREPRGTLGAMLYKARTGCPWSGLSAPAGNLACMAAMADVGLLGAADERMGGCAGGGAPGGRSDASAP
ncbi:hypothetical protein ACTPOK_08415 [Streptomyces inhibens]|uniref:hypothetical protein n=1 Tax=Streptomyces inhibens TaxID=2293571 RepID=UPI00402A8DE2